MKTLKLFSLLACMMLCSMTINAQIQVEEGSFKRIDDYVMTDKHDHTDMNDAPMALIKITTKNIFAEQRTKFSFKGNAITYFDVQFEPGEIYLYLSAQAATFIEIIHEDYGKTEYWLPYTLCDFCAYEMVVEYTSKKEEAELIVSGNMDNSLIYIDGKLLGIKEAKKMSEVGATHTWKIVCDDYQTESGTVTLNGKTEIYKVLKPVIVDESLDGMKKKTKKQNRFFLGINAGVGGGLHRGHDWNTGVEEYPSLQYSLGLDMSFPINRTLSLGAFASVGMETSKVVNNPTDKIDVSIGPLVTLNFKNKSVFLIGAGLNVYNHSRIPFFDVFGETYAIMENDKFFNIGVTSRIGCQFPSKFYIMGEFIFNDARNMDDNLRFWASCYDYSEYYYKYVDFHCKNVAVLIHFGYRIF